MRYTHTTNIECPSCSKEISVTGKCRKTHATYWEPPEYEVEEVDVTKCPECGYDVEGMAMDAVYATDEGPQEEDEPDYSDEFDPSDAEW